MKTYIVTLLFFISVTAFSQVTINVQLPPAGLSLKNQLWNILATNGSANTMWVHFELRMTDIVRNVQVMNGSTAPVYLSPGNQLLQTGLLSPIQYNITDPSLQEFAASEFLPVGRFLICYSIIRHNGDGTEKIGEECEVAEIEPLVPPQLIYPYHQETIETKQPLFNWIAPSPVTLFTSLNYDLEVTEIFPNQTEADAVQQNIPLFRQSGINANSYPYPAGAASLETGRQYAWRILAKNGEAIVGTSETWRFTLKEDSKKDSLEKSRMPFAKTRKDNQPSYALAYNNLKFEYINETKDTSWNLRVVDISNAKQKEIPVAMDSIKLGRGQNLVSIPLFQSPGFIHKHIYLLQIRNSRNELLQLKFEFRREDQTNLNHK